MNEIDDLLLFAVDGNRAVEVTHREGLEFASDITPLFENTKVLKPVPVMVEGTYHIFDVASKAWKKISITANDIREYLFNTPRDVAINYEHNRGGAAKGWLRLKDTGAIRTVQTRNGPREALFAAIELFEQAADDVRRGLFRDVSIELKPVSREILGTALTSYPIMRDVQFYSQTASESVPHAVAEADETVVLTSATVSDNEATDGGTTTSDSTAFSQPTPPDPQAEASPPPDTNDQEFSMDDNLKLQALSEALQQYGLTPEDLSEIPNMLQTIEQQKANLAFSQAKEQVRTLVTADDGSLKLAPGSMDAAAQLYAFCQQNAELQFSVDGTNLNPTQLFEQVMAGVQAVQVFGATQDEEGNVVAEAQGEIPTGDPEEAFDANRASGIAARIRSRLQETGRL